MTIGTAKPSVEELSRVKHYFIDEFPITQSLSVADYEQLALGYLHDIFKTTSKAVVCGGTGLYIKALCEGIDEMPQIDPSIDKAVNEAYRQSGIEWLQEAVKAEDPDFYAQGEIYNPARLIRALVFIRSTGSSIFSFRTHTKKQRPFTITKIGLELSREQLYERINLRVDQMMERGLEHEARALFPMRHLKNLNTVGYTELFAYTEGKCSLNDAVTQIKRNTRHYAKRQMTWFKKDKDIHWLMADDPLVAEKIISLYEY